jgi:hypothetical protein
MILFDAIGTLGAKRCTVNKGDIGTVPHWGGACLNRIALQASALARNR